MSILQQKLAMHFTVLTMRNGPKEWVQSGYPQAACGCLALIAFVIAIVGTTQRDKSADFTSAQCMYRDTKFSRCTDIYCIKAKHYYITQNSTCSSLYYTTECVCGPRPQLSAAKNKSDGWVPCYIDSYYGCAVWTFTHPADTSREMAVVAFIVTAILIIITVGCIVYAVRSKKQAQAVHDIPVYDTNVQHIVLNAWGHICGGTGGQEFGSLGTNNNSYKITGIRLYGGQYLNSIQFQVNHQMQSKAGGDGGNGPNELVLGDGEYFNKIDITTGEFVEYIKFYTNRFRSVTAGRNGGGQNSIGNGMDHMLIDCKGRSGDLIDQLQFKWDEFVDNEPIQMQIVSLSNDKDEAKGGDLENTERKKQSAPIDVDDVENTNNDTPKENMSNIEHAPCYKNTKIKSHERLKIENKDIAPSAPDPLHDIECQPGDNNYERKKYEDTNIMEGEDEGFIGNDINDKQRERKRIKHWFDNKVALFEDTDIYFNLFIENGWDKLQIIKYITNSDLQEIGIKKSGHRKAILLATKHI